MLPCAVAETLRTSYAAVEVATHAPKFEQCGQSINKGTLRLVKNAMIKKKATKRFCHLECSAQKENLDFHETVAGIDSLDDEKKMEFAQAIGRQGGATSHGAGASMCAGVEKLKRGSGHEILNPTRASSSSCEAPSSSAAAPLRPCLDCPANLAGEPIWKKRCLECWRKNKKT